MHGAGIRVSIFLDADPDQVAAAKSAGADAVEINTGRYADAAGTAAAERDAHRRGGLAGRAERSRGARRPWAELRECAGDHDYSRNRRAQYRPQHCRARGARRNGPGGERHGPPAMGVATPLRAWSRYAPRALRRTRAARSPPCVRGGRGDAARHNPHR